MLKTLDSKDSAKIKEKTFYIFIIFSKNKDENIAFNFDSDKAKQIYSLKQTINAGTRNIFIIKYIYTPKNPSETVELSFNNKGEIFKVSFGYNEGTFIFNPTLKIKKNKTSNEKTIEQKNSIKIIDKIDIFTKCLEKENEKIKLGTLYSDGVDFFNSNQDFELLLYLFIKVCGIGQSFKDICKKLLDIFWDSTSNEKIEKIKNLRNENESCKKYLDEIKKIESSSEKLISEYSLDKARFYGFILLYLNNYDLNQFLSLSKKLQGQKEKQNFFFDILVHYSSNFSNDINVNLEKYVKFLSDKDFKTLETSGFAYFKRIEEFIKIINENKMKLVKMTGFKTLKIPTKLNYNLENPEAFIKELNDILYFSQNQTKLLIFFSGTFWKKMTEVLGRPSADNIYYLFQLRKNFKEYLKFVNEHYKKEHNIYLNAEETDGKDELAVILNRIIQKNIEEEKEITNDEIINQITKFDIYYLEDIYINRRELNFLDKINFDEKETEWMSKFKGANFENIFKNDIENFILKLDSKIKKMEDLGTAISIINEENIKNMDKMEYLIGLLKRKALNLMKNSNALKEPKIKSNKLKSLISLFKIIYKHTKKVEKIRDIFDTLENESKHIVLMELLKSFKKDQSLVDYIFDFYIHNINVYYKNIIELFEILNEEDIKNFMQKISGIKDDKKNYRIISYENFFTEKESLNLNLLQELNKKIDKIKTTYYFGESKKVLERIYKNIEEKKLEIRNLKSLLLYPKDNVIKRFELLNILNRPLNPNDKYEELKAKYEKAQEEIKELKKISDALKEFHKDFHKEEIKKIEEKINKFNNGEIKEFDNISKLIMELGDDFKKKAERINKIKQSSIFKKLFNNTQGTDDDNRFETAFKKLKPEFISVYRKTKTVDEKLKKEFQIIIDILGLKDDEQTQKELKYMEDSSGAEEDIKSMLYFSENFKVNANDNNHGKEDKLELEDILREKYENIKNNIKKKENLNELKKMNIYDCEHKGIDVEFFNLFNNQKEAIDFLLTKSHENLEIIKDKIISIDNAVKASDIEEVDNCIDIFNNVLRNCKNKYDLFEKIKKINETSLGNFKKFIQIFPYLVELDNNSDNSYNLYIQANKYFINAKYYISLNYEEYSYIDIDHEKEEKTIDLDIIKSIKHKINIPNEVEIRLKENNDLPEGQERISFQKTMLLLKFKEVVSNIELIEQFIWVFQTKGCSLPIEIEISIKYPEVTYFLKKRKIPFADRNCNLDLSKYLLNVKNYLEKSLDSNYKREQNLRFLYGKQFDTLNRHITGSESIPSFLRYILNNLNDDQNIKEGEKSFPSSTKNYVEGYKDYTNDWFKIYNNYISSVLQANGISIEELYEKMKIKSNDKKTYNGIYLYKSDYNSMEEDILKIFIEKTRNIPIAQNILISNKETSFEEIQAFFYRAFLCRFNTLFAIEINDSLSDIQLRIMINFISQLLKFQLDKYNKKMNEKEKVDIKETSKYIEPLIIFVYNVNKLNESFLNEINKFNPGEYPKIKDNIFLMDKQSTKSKKELIAEKVEFQLNQILLKNTHIISSEICGLGKTEKIKYLIKENKKEYIYFPLGGKLSRNIIFKKLEAILKRVKNMKTAIHLDLYETEDTSILNEFLFSFCFTKFYANEKNVLYIPIKIEIYIEIPNCYNNFLQNYPILNYFEIVRIEFKNREKLRLDREKTKFFNWMIPEQTIEGKVIQKAPEEYINENIGASKFSYHQVNIFIKLFMNQYKIDNKKLFFIDNGKNVTEECIKKFAKCTQYFTLGVYAKFLTKGLDEERDASLEKDSIKSLEDISTNNNDLNQSSYESNINLNLTFDQEKKSINQNEINYYISNDKSDNSKEKSSKEINQKIGKDYEELRKNYISKLSELYKKDLEDEKYEIPLIFIIKNTKFYKEIFLSDNKLKEYNESDIKFLDEIKVILQIENPVSKDEKSNLKSLKEIIDQDNYVITSDNFRKMILILYRLLANIPVILMGETGCGKTGLIRKLYQLLNNGEDMDPKKNMVNVDSSISDEKLIEKMEEINREAKKKKGKDFWVLFDEINTCNSLGLLNEIFINRSYDGIKIENNIRLIGTCNPYRLKSDKEESCGLSHPYKNKALAYDVNILPQSLMYFVFNFGALQKEDEDKYIYSILSNHFKNLSKGLINIVKEIISKCHEYLRKLYGLSVVSLREIKRFIKLYDNLVKYYKNKDMLDLDNCKIEYENEKKDKNSKKTKKIKKVIIIPNDKRNLYQIKSFIVATYLSYYIRLIDPEKRTNFEAEIKSKLIELANYYYKNEEKGDEIKDNKKKEDEELKKNENLRESQYNSNNPLGIKWKPLLNDYKNCKSEDNKNFSLFFENECDYIIEEINLDKGIAKNRILKENIFLQFIAITSNIPLIIIGKPGSSKSLSFQQLKKSMRGKYSKSFFFRKYPQILSTYFQGSESTLAEDIDNLFERGKDTLKKYEDNPDNKPISLLIFDEIGLSEFAKDNPVKVLHKNLEYDGVKDGLSFVGFSNWKLDSSKLNRVLYLSVPDLDRQVDDLKDTAKCISESIRENNIDQIFLDILCRSYKSYKEMVKKIKEYIVFKEFELQEMKQVLDSLTQDEIKKIFKKDKKDIILDDFKKERNKIKTNVNKKYSWKYGNFSDVKKMNEYKVLYTNNRSINEEFHGNRDFYNYIRGVCNIKSLSKNLENIDPDISQQIEKVIERNFGGVDINLDLDLDLGQIYNDEIENMEKINNILNKYPNAKIELKLPSVFLFKYIYNEELKSLYKVGDDDESDDDDNSILDKYKIIEDNLTKYDLVQCINGNINDNDARFLLLEIEEGLKYLVYQNIISQNKDKVITFMEGSPFTNDIKDKSGEYKIKKISEIQNYCNKEMLLILSNLNQIYPFLYDFFNRNFIIKEDKKYGRICQGNFTEQLTYVHDKFRIIVMIDKNYIYKQESPFLNRFEKAIVKFEELLNDRQRASSRNIFNELGIKGHVEKIKFNYNIENLLINYDKTSIDRLYFYYSNQNLKQEEIKQKIIEKIARTLPQDIIINFEDDHPIKSIYNKKNIFNFKEYISYLNKLATDKKNDFKFSIIYTFSSIISNIEGINENGSQQIISEIKRENHLIELINEKKFKKKKSDNNFFIMHFYQHELDKINFIISTLKNNYADEEIKFIFIVHIKRIMDKKKKEKIYSIPDIDEKVDQIFIDNLNGLNVSLDIIAKKGIKSILENPKLVDKNNEFFKALKAYYNIYTNNIYFIEDYLPKIIKYFNDNNKFIDIILSKAFSLIIPESKNNDKNDNKENIESFNKIKEELFTNSYITHNTIDIVSSIINDEIIGNKLKDAIIKVIDALETNNFLTTLLTLDNNTSNESFTSKENLTEMMKKFLNSLTITDIQRKAKFEAKYLVPGFFSFYYSISNFISKNIAQNFFKNEKKLRDALKGSITKLKNNFHLEEANLLDILYKEIIADEKNIYKFINEVINECPSDFLLNDYIYYFLNKNSENINITSEEPIEIDSNISSIQNDEEDEKEDEKEVRAEKAKKEGFYDFYVIIIKQIIDLKYKDETKIISENNGNEFKKFLIKIIWLEANKDYIFTIIQLFKEAQIRIYMNNKRNMLLEQVNNLIRSKKIKYITDENRNPEHTTEVNECFYIIMGALYLAITDLEKIVLFDPDNNKDFVEAEENQVKVKIDIYFKCLQYIVKISQPFNKSLYLFSNELYIIINLNSIINLLKLQKNEYIDIQIVEKIVKNLRESINIIRENKTKTDVLRKNIEELINLISENLPNKDKNYYSLLRGILLQEIMKVKDKNYRLDLFKSYIINEKEILLNSNEIFDLLFKGIVNPSKENFLISVEKFYNKGDELLLVLENKIKEKKNEYLSQILLYFFEKISLIYFDNYFKKDKKNEKSEKREKSEKILFEDEPFNVFEKCLSLLSKLSSSRSKIKNMSKLLYIGYIRAFLFKFEQYIRDKSEKLSDPKKIINSINSFKNPVSFMVELYFYKVIYNKNSKDINIFSSKKKLYYLESLNNFNDLFNSQINDNNSIEEKEENDENDDNNGNENSIINLLEEKDNKLKYSEEKYPFKKYFYYSDYIDEKYLTSIINNECKDYPVLAKYLELRKNGNILNDFYTYNMALNLLNEEFSSKITRDYAYKETLDKQFIYQDNKNIFNKFFDIYNKLSCNNDNENDNDNDNDNDSYNNNENNNIINMNLNPNLPLFNFFIFDENEFSEKYKYFYKQFINNHNEIVENLLNSKSKYIEVENQNKNKINIQNITKEEEIFNTKKDFSIQNILFNNSYRKVIINDDYSEFNKYEINLEYVEEVMTDNLLKNKKLISDEIFEFKYKNEDLEFENKDICTKFKEKINEEELSIDDKIIIYEYFEENKGNVNLHLKLLDDFAYLIIYSCKEIDKMMEPSQTKICKLFEGLESISNDFKEIFKERNNFAINKLLNLYEYYQILCFNRVKDKLHQYQEKITDEKQKELINNYIKDLKANENIKKIIEIAIRKFILCFLAKEKDKEKKIKLNKNNIGNYLEIEDLWNKDFYKKKEFYQELKNLKTVSIKVNNVIPFYEKCFNNMYKNYFDDVKTELKNREEERIRKEKEKEKEDISNFNPKDVDIDIDDNQKEPQENKIEENGGNNNEDGDDNSGDSYINEEEDEDNDDDGDRY